MAGQGPGSLLGAPNVCLDRGEVSDPSSWSCAPTEPGFSVMQALGDFHPWAPMVSLGSGMCVPLNGPQGGCGGVQVMCFGFKGVFCSKRH